MTKPKDWRTYERHPISAGYPDLKGQAWEDFRDNLKKRGIRGRSITLHDGKILDGWQLYRACLDLDKEPTFAVLREGEDPEEFVDEANDHRRHESAEKICERRDKRRERVAKGRQEGKSTRTMAEEEGVSHPTILNDISVSGGKGLPPEPPKEGITGQDAKLYPSSGRTKKAKRTPTKDSKAGQILFDWSAFQSKFGYLLRTVDELGNAYNCNKCKEAESLRRKLGEWHKDFKVWAEFQTKQRMPNI